MSKNKVSFIILFVLIIIAAIYYFSASKGTLHKANFAIEKSEKITSVKFTADEKQILLENKGDYWEVNQSFKIKPRLIDDFFIVLNRIDILSPVSKMEKQQIASILKNDGILVEIQKGNRIIRKFFVSRPSMNKNKTYMMMFNSKEPYLVHTPSSKVNIANWFILNESFWRDKSVFDLLPQNIGEIVVEYPADVTKSFKLINYNDGTFSLHNLPNDSEVENFDVQKVARYFTYFRNITFEKELDNIPAAQVDSILNSKPFVKITVNEINGRKTVLKAYRKPSEKKLDEFGQKIKYDYDRAYALLNDSRELILIQYYLFDPLFKEIDYFR